MKKQFKTLIVMLCVITTCNNTFSQQTFFYPLTDDFNENESLYSPLEELPNPQGLTGNFTTVSANNNLCNSGQDMPLYFFENNSGLRFVNVDTFISCAYTIEMVFHIEEFPSSFFESPWRKILGFSNDDTGFFFYKDPLLNFYSFELWENETILSQCVSTVINEQDWYKLTITRDCAGLVEIFFNCELMCSFNDSPSSLFLPQNSTGNQIIFFQDDPAVLAAEASPGFVKNIKISNFEKSNLDVLASCSCLCEELADCEIMVNNLLPTCDPNEVQITSDTISSNAECNCDTIVMNEFFLQLSDTIFLEETSCFEDSIGLFTQNLQNINGCDSIVFLNINLAESPLLQDSLVVPDSGNSNGSISLNIVGGNPPYTYLWNTGSTSFSITNLPANNYSVTVTDQNNCSLTLFFEVEMVNALLELPTTNFKIYPNPNHLGNSFFLEFDFKNTKKINLDIFDISGKLLFGKSLLASSVTSKYSLEVSLKSGIYFIKILDEEGRSNVKKIVVLD